MASYSMFNSPLGYAYGGGGFGGLGDIGASFYGGLGSSMNALTSLYNFQDQNALRQDVMDANAASLRNTKYTQGVGALKQAGSQSALIGSMQCPAGYHKGIGTDGREMCIPGEKPTTQTVQSVAPSVAQVPAYTQSGFQYQPYMGQNIAGIGPTAPVSPLQRTIEDLRGRAYGYQYGGVK